MSVSRDALDGVNLSALDVPETLLLGPGPSNPNPRVLRAMSAPTVGHLHPPMTAVMDDIQALLRYTFQTKNEYTFALNGSGALCMEATVTNVLERGETILIGCNGYWGYRMTNVAERLGFKVQQIVKEWGEVITVDEVEAALAEHKPAAFFVTNGESSTGLRQPLEGMGDVCRKHDALFIVDTVVTLGGRPLFVDEWKIDVVYSGAQKCLGCPPGFSPISFGERAVERIKARKTPVPSFYTDLFAVYAYWDGKAAKRAYHHTGPVNHAYALRESLLVIAEEGLEKAWDRHTRASEALYAGLESLGLKPFIENRDVRLDALTTVCIPDGVDGAAVCKWLMENHQIEIAGGLGALGGKVWRIGLMGYNARVANVNKVVAALRAALAIFRADA